MRGTKRKGVGPSVALSDSMAVYFRHTWNFSLGGGGWLTLRMYVIYVSLLEIHHRNYVKISELTSR